MNQLRYGVFFGLLTCSVYAEDCPLPAALDRAAAQEPNNVGALLSAGVNRFRCGVPAGAIDLHPKLAHAIIQHFGGGKLPTSSTGQPLS